MLLEFLENFKVFKFTDLLFYLSETIYSNFYGVNIYEKYTCIEEQKV